MKKTKRNTFTLPIELSEQLDKVAKKLGLKKSKMVRDSLVKHLLILEKTEKV
ncbi:hypothetical protein ACOJTA_05650 [Malaciobacter sp. WC5094]